MGRERRRAVGDHHGSRARDVTLSCAFDGCGHLTQYVVCGPLTLPVDGGALHPSGVGVQIWVCPEHVDAAVPYVRHAEVLWLAEIRRSDVPFVVRHLFGIDDQPFIEVPALVGLG